MTMLSDIEWIKIAIANTYGNDKSLWVDRLLWVESHTTKELWAMVDDASEPYQMRKALHALEDVLAGKPSGYTLGLDSTASGCQIFAAISGCKVSAKAVNLIGDGIRHDLYTDIGNVLGVSVARNDLKQAIMTAFYQSTKLPKQVFGNDVDAFYDCLRKNMPGAWEVLELCVAAQSCIGDSYAFQNPSGHDVLIRQKVTKAYEVNASTGYDWTRDYSFIQERTEFGLKVDWKGRPNDKSIGANLAHTGDSWYANTVVDTCKEQFNFEAYHVFDQFFCSPKYMNRMRWVAREVLAMLAESNWLQDALRQITGDASFVYTKHSDDLASEIRKADYFIN